MINKILVFWGLAATAILVIENFVLSNTAAVFWYNASTNYILALVCTGIWMAIWYGIKWMFEQKSPSEDEVDF